MRDFNVRAAFELLVCLSLSVYLGQTPEPNHEQQTISSVWGRFSRRAANLSWLLSVCAYPVFRILFPGFLSLFAVCWLLVSVFGWPRVWSPVAGCVERRYPASFHFASICPGRSEGRTSTDSPLSALGVSFILASRWLLQAAASEEL